MFCFFVILILAFYLQFRRPLRVYLFETLLFLTVVTFMLQIGYVFLPVFQNDNSTTEPVNENQDKALQLKEGIIHVDERDVHEEIDKTVNDGAPKHRLRKHQLEAEAAKAAAGAKNEPKKKEDKKPRMGKQSQGGANQNNLKKEQVGINKPNHGGIQKNRPNAKSLNLDGKPQHQPAKLKDAVVKTPRNPDAKPQNLVAKPHNPNAKSNNSVAQPKNTGAKPKNTNAKPNSAIGQKKKAAEAQQPTECRLSVLILGGMKIVETWSELTTLVAFLKQHTINEGVTYRAPIQCPKHDCTIDLTFSSNFSNQMPGKDAVILNVAPYTLLTQMSKLLKPNFPESQLWFLYGVETPLRIHKWIKHIGSLPIHGMWSYLSDSEIHMPYAYYRPGEPVTNKARQSDKFWVKDKTNLVAWMGSNCVKEVFWPRMGYIEELQKHVHIDTYGRCGNLSCLPRLSEHCKNLMNSYKFYLSFENAECDEYITEKMWDTALQHGVVPVVYGAHKADYERLAPPNSFIYAGDFKSPKQLAEYLLKLDKRPDLYAKYFEWRYKGSVVQVYPDLEPSTFCEVIPYIKKVKDGELKKKPTSAFPWFNSCRTRIEKVFNPKDIPTLQKWNPWFSA